MSGARKLLGVLLVEAALSFVGGLASALGENLANRIAPPKRETSSGDEKEKP